MRANDIPQIAAAATDLLVVCRAHIIATRHETKSQPLDFDRKPARNRPLLGCVGGELNRPRMRSCLGDQVKLVFESSVSRRRETRMDKIFGNEWKERGLTFLGQMYPDSLKCTSRPATRAQRAHSVAST